MKLIIKKSDLLNTPCDEYNNLPDGKFDVIKEIANRGNHVEHIGWLMTNCKLAQTPKMLAYFKSLNPSVYDVYSVIKNCKLAQTPKMLEYYKSLKPSIEDVHFLITDYKFAQTANMLEYYKSLNPPIEDIHWLINHCKFASRYGIA